MTTTTEAAGAVITLMRASLAGDPLPDVTSPAGEATAARLSLLVSQAGERDLVGIGYAALHVLMEHWHAHVEAQRAQLQARLRALRADDDAGTGSLH